MKKVFISYRRMDTYDTNRLAEFLRAEFGFDNVFFDTESLRPGDNWPGILKDNLLQSDIMLLIIGPNWLHTQDVESGRRRIDMETDWVRTEIITFLERKKNNTGLLLVPVLVNEAIMPDPHYLDDLLDPICDCQAIKLYSRENAIDFFQVREFLLENGMVPVYPRLVETPQDRLLPNRLSKSEEDEFFKKYPEWKAVYTAKPGEPGTYMRELYRFFNLPVTTKRGVLFAGWIKKVSGY